MAETKRKIVIGGVEYEASVERLPDEEEPKEECNRRVRWGTWTRGQSRAFNPARLGHRPKMDFESMDEDL